MQYNPKIGVIGNIKLLFSERNKTNGEVFNNKNEAEHNVLEAEADMVEAVIDEFYSVIGEERKDENV